MISELKFLYCLIWQIIFIKNYDFKNAKNKCEDALKLSRKTKDQIYRPYIYNSLGLIYLNDNQYKKSRNFLDKASSSFRT